MRAMRWLAGLALVAYPVIVWLGLSNLEDGGSPRWIALLLLLLVLPVVVAKMRSSKRSAVRGLAAVPLITVFGLVAAVVLDTAGFMLVVPAAINAVLLVAFGVTLRGRAMPMIERFARLQEPDLDSAQRAWCRLWTWIWCGFFLLNGGTALALAVAAPLQWWALYNGLVAYGLIGALLVSEWWLRRRRFPGAASEGEGS